MRNWNNTPSSWNHTLIFSEHLYIILIVWFINQWKRQSYLIIVPKYQMRKTKFRRPKGYSSNNELCRWKTGLPIHCPVHFNYIRSFFRLSQQAIPLQPQVILRSSRVVSSYHLLWLNYIPLLFLITSIFAFFSLSKWQAIWWHIYDGL